METGDIKKKIEEVKIKLIPLFGVTDDEKRKFEVPLIIRELDNEHYPKNDLKHAAYESVRNFMYFPLEGKIEEREFIYFTSCYLHHQINFSVRKVAFESVAHGKDMSEEYCRIRTLVGDYPNMIFRNFELYQLFYYKDLPRVFFDKGKDFLPELARMSIEEALEKDIIRI